MPSLSFFIKHIPRDLRWLPIALLLIGGDFLFLGLTFFGLLIAYPNVGNSQTVVYPVLQALVLKDAGLMTALIPTFIGFAIVVIGILIWQTKALTRRVQLLEDLEHKHGV